MTWFWLTILYLLFLGTAEIINKKTLNNSSIDEVMFGAFVQVATAISGLLFAVFTTGWHFQFTSESLPLVLLVGVVYFFAVSLYFTGLKKTDLSLVSILGSSGAIFSLILGIFVLNERIQIDKVVGVVLIIGAGFVLFYKNIRKISRYSLSIIISMFFYALGAILDKRINSYGNPLSYLTVSFASAGLLYFRRGFRRRRL